MLYFEYGLPSISSIRRHLIANATAKVKTLANWDSTNSTESPTPGTSLWWMWHDDQRGPAFCQETGRGRSQRSFWGCQDITQCSVGEEQCAGPAADARGGGMRLEREKHKESLMKEHINTYQYIFIQRRPLYSIVFSSICSESFCAVALMSICYSQQID